MRTALFLFLTLSLLILLFRNQPSMPSDLDNAVLTYYPICGRGEAIRLLFEDNG